MLKFQMLQFHNMLNLLSFAFYFSFFFGFFFFFLFNYPYSKFGCTVLGFGFSPCDVVHHGSKVGRPVKLHRPQALMIRLQDALNAVAVWIFHVPILEKTIPNRWTVVELCWCEWVSEWASEWVDLTSGNSCDTRPSGGNLAPKPRAGNILSLS